MKCSLGISNFLEQTSFLFHCFPLFLCIVCTRTQEKGAVTPQETDPDLPVSVQYSLAEAWVGGGLLQDWGP